MGRIISETCQAIWYVLNNKGFITAPTSKKEWLEFATKFDNKWIFLHCLGAIDGKHVIIQATPRSGSTFSNYKKSFGIVLLAVYNANYEFTLVGVGEAGRQSDGDIYNNSNLGMEVDGILPNIPETATVKEYSITKKCPFVFVADETFALKPFMLRPFLRRNDLNLYELVFDYRLSRVIDCLVTENTSGY